MRSAAQGCIGVVDQDAENVMHHVCPTCDRVLGEDAIRAGLCHVCDDENVASFHATRL